MLFPTIDFAIFFAVVFTGSWLLSARPSPWKLFTLASSYVFYAWWQWRFVGLLLLATGMAHLGASAVYRYADQPRLKRASLWLSVGALLAVLAYFKYYGFFAVNLDNLAQAMGLGQIAPLIQPTLPIAISFFTFMAISYVIDVSRGSLLPASPIDLAVYLAFFPHLVAGPIVRGAELLPQLRRRRDPNGIDFTRAGYLILGGLFKKVVISSYLASAIVDPVFASPSSHSAIDVLVAAWAYACQIYCDFSGYTDIAIGLALLLGIKFPVNFDSPYTARTLQEFWRRWHITLSRWLRDYLYIPLGGNHGSRGETSRNIALTMVLGGLWHGANWTFLIWGLMHGLGQVLGHLRRGRLSARGLLIPAGPLTSIRQRFLTFQFVCLAWIFFRATSLSNAQALLSRLGSGWSTPSSVSIWVLVLIVGVLSVQYLRLEKLEGILNRLAAVPLAVQALGIAFGLFVITTLGPSGVAPFIYYRF